MGNNYINSKYLPNETERSKETRIEKIIPTDQKYTPQETALATLGRAESVGIQEPAREWRGGEMRGRPHNTRSRHQMGKRSPRKRYAGKRNKNVSQATKQRAPDNGNRREGPSKRIRTSEKKPNFQTETRQSKEEKPGSHITGARDGRSNYADGITFAKARNAIPGNKRLTRNGPSKAETQKLETTQNTSNQIKQYDEGTRQSDGNNEWRQK